MTRRAVKRRRVVVITGASSGIGRATALRFAEKGADVVLASRRAAALDELARECGAAGAAAIAVPTDTTEPSAVDALADRAVAAFGRIDVWVNAAAVSVFAPFTSTPLDEFRRVIDVNLMGYVHGARAALRTMTEQGSGVLIDIASIVGEVPQPYTAPYGMSKAALRALDVTLRSELSLAGLRHVHVVTVLPATIDTPFFRHSANHTGRRIVAMPPVYPPQKVARAIVKSATSPRAEVVVGALGKAFVAQHRATPRPVEGQMALQTEGGQLSRTQAAADTAGTLFEPANSPTDATVTGGWRGRQRTARRRAIALAVAAVGIALLIRARKRTDA
jgi:short-subunit dehydrogenase